MLPILLGNSFIILSASCQVTVIVDASEAEEFSQVVTKPLRALPYDTPGQIFVAFEKPDGVPAVGKFSNMLRFTVKEVQVLPLSS
jgi:coatomer protein complex subunit gamma